MAYAMYSASEEVDRIPVAARSNVWIWLSESLGPSDESQGCRICASPKSILVLQAGETAALEVVCSRALSIRKMYDEEASPFQRTRTDRLEVIMRSACRGRLEHPSMCRLLLVGMRA